MIVLHESHIRILQKLRSKLWETLGCKLGTAIQTVGFIVELPEYARRVPRQPYLICTQEFLPNFWVTGVFVWLSTSVSRN